MGAVNCVVRRDDKLIGENTDGKGFLKSLMEVVDPRGKHIVMFGAGGAARAIGVELAVAGAVEITVVNRSEARGAALVDLLNRQTTAKASLVVWDRIYSIPADAAIVVNATSIGLFPDVDGELDIATDTLRPGIVVADVIPNPPRTRLLREAEARGCMVIDGLGMLINQGVIGIRYWTGIDADPGVKPAWARAANGSSSRSCAFWRASAARSGTVAGFHNDDRRSASAAEALRRRPDEGLQGQSRRQ